MKSTRDYLLARYKTQIRKHFGLKTKKNRILRKYLHRYLDEVVFATEYVCAVDVAEKDSETCYNTVHVTSG